MTITDNDTNSTGSGSGGGSSEESSGGGSLPLHYLFGLILIIFYRQKAESIK